MFPDQRRDYILSLKYSDDGAPMIDAKNIDALARRYLDLWQKHLNTVTRDRETANMMARTMALISSGVQFFAAQAQSPKKPPSLTMQTPRLVPRPLPLHLAIQSLRALSCLCALPLLRNGLLHLSPSL
jgi:hypothetical protein